MRQMKNHSKQILTLSGTIMLLFITMSSCVDYFTTDARPIRLEAADQNSATRAGSDIQGSSFDQNEIVNVYINGKSNDFDEYIIGAPMQCRTSAPNNGKNTLIPIGMTPYFPTGTGSEVSIYATYPDFVTSDVTTFTVKNDQRSDDNYKNSDLMFVAPNVYSKTNEIIPLPFEHKMAKMIILASAGDNCSVDNYLTLSGVKTSISIVPTADNIIDGNDDDVYDVSFSDDNPYGEIIMSNGGAVLFPPQTVTADKFITVSGTYKDKNGETHTNAKASFDIAEKTFEPGKVYMLNLSIGADNFTTDVNIVGWLSEYGEITMTPSGGYDGVTIDDIPSVEYTGQPIEPTPTVHYGTINVKDLVLNSDYTFKYVDNVNVGRAQALVLGKNYYAGMAAVQSFYITQAKGSISFPEDANEKATVGYTIGGKITNIKVINTGDGKVTYTSSNTHVATVDGESGEVSIWNEGTAVISATVADGRNYTYLEGQNSASYTVTVAERQASNLQVSYEPAYFTYDGTEHELTSITVTDGGNTLAYGTDYTFSFINNKDVGNAILTVTGQGNYTSTVTANVEIRKATPTIAVDETDLYMGIHSSSAPQNRRKLRKATTDTWAEGTLEYSSSDETVVKVNKTTGQLVGQPIPAGHENEDDYKIRSATIYVDVKSTTNYNDAIRKSFKVYVVKSDYNFAYTGSYQIWTCPATGVWQFDCYGAQGASTPRKDPNGNNYKNCGSGGKGAHIAGKLRLVKGERFYVNVGQQGRNLLAGEHRLVADFPINEVDANGNYYGTYELCGYAWNGGANSIWGCHSQGQSWNVSYVSAKPNSSGNPGTCENPVSGGGGATDISLNMGTYVGNSYMRGYTGNPIDSLNWKSPEHLYSRIIVAGGGGGALHYEGETSSVYLPYADGGDGGAYIGGNGKGQDYGTGGQLNCGGYGGILYNPNAPNHVAFADPIQYQFTFAKYYAKYVDGPHTGGWSGTDGIFGEGGFYTCLDEGNGCGGGGWFGGGAAGQQGVNGSGAGGSSYLWCPDMASYYTSLTFPAGMSAPSTKYYMEEVVAEAGANTGNGKATIRVVTLEDDNPNN